MRQLAFKAVGRQIHVSDPGMRATDRLLEDVELGGLQPFSQGTLNSSPLDQQMLSEDLLCPWIFLKLLPVVLCAWVYLQILEGPRMPGSLTAEAHALHLYK